MTQPHPSCPTQFTRRQRQVDLKASLVYPKRSRKAKATYKERGGGREGERKREKENESMCLPGLFSLSTLLPHKPSQDLQAAPSYLTTHPSEPLHPEDLLWRRGEQNQMHRSAASVCPGKWFPPRNIMLLTKKKVKCLIPYCLYD